ncbi:PrsW family intramembrane metalloprotease [Streptomyces sp. uw30]|uniref:PrsW family glutamic-type intramembrane protease n=1 Tax=Streptomyces sp. uw30 TaxID=1828179 RepID=UPI0011CD363D|nr:PrsW family glutamic-type intramembrane protease [Streptomyces sp. uw30]TXS40349.1 PrsW family intramembrane metalloprotease [Streptomyces sp. uw30]
MSTAAGAVATVPGRPPARVPRSGMAGAIVVALSLSAVYAVGQILFWTAPELTSRLTWLKFFLLPAPKPFQVTRVLLLIGWGVAALLAIGVLLTRRGGAPEADSGDRSGSERTVRSYQFGILGALLLPFTAMPLAGAFGNLPQLLLCLPTTLAALFLVHRVQFYRRMPGWLLLTGFGWGALIGGGFGIVMITWFQRAMPGYFMSRYWERPQDSVRELYTLFPLNTAIVTELGKAAGVAVLFLLFRRHIDSVVSGVVLGAAVGLGFNLTETVHYLSFVNPEHHFTQFWDRQVVGLMAAHVAFTALAGAGIGAARWLPARRDRLLAVGGGLLAAVGGHFETDVMLMRLDNRRADWYADETLGLLVGIPVMTLITSGVFVALYVLILRSGLKAQAAGLADALRAEAATGHGAVTEPEIGLLLSPRRRLLLELRVWRRDGTAGLRHLLRFQQAQLDLAVQRRHRARPGADSFIPPEGRLRERVLELKGAPTTSQTPSLPAQEALS